MNWLRTYFTRSAPSFVTTFDEATAFISQGYPELAQFSTPEKVAEAAPEIPRQYQFRINEVITYLNANRAALTAQSGDAAYRLALQHAKVLLLGMAQAGIVDADAGIEYRDNYMAQNLKWILEHENNAKVMALAHNGAYSEGADRRHQKIGREVDGLSPAESVRQPLLRARLHVQRRRIPGPCR